MSRFSSRLIEFAATVLRLFRPWEPRAIGSVLLIVASAWLFLAIAGEVMEGDTQAIDTRLLKALRDLENPAKLRGPIWLEEVMRDLTALGGFPVLILMTGGVVGFLFLAGYPRNARFVLTAVIGGWIVSHLLKMLFDRPRPDVVPHLSHVNTSSFPSGHSMMAAVVYLTLGSMLTNLVTSWRLKGYFLGISALLTMLVGLSRLWMGVHYPSDVLAGWCVGLAWAEVCWLVHSRLLHRAREREGGSLPSLDVQQRPPPTA